MMARIDEGRIAWYRSLTSGSHDTHTDTARRRLAERPPKNRRTPEQVANSEPEDKTTSVLQHGIRSRITEN
jgi:hypothetical protein